MPLAMKVTDVTGMEILTDGIMSADNLAAANAADGVLELGVFQDEEDGEIGLALELDTKQETLYAETLGPYADWNAAVMSAYALTLYSQENYDNIEVNAPDVEEQIERLPKMVEAWTVKLSD